MAICEKKTDKMCGTCRFFRLHYVCEEDGRYVPLYYGHCIYPQLKQRACIQVCPYWFEE